MSHLIKPEGQLSDRIETFDVAPLFVPPICFVSMHLSFPFLLILFPFTSFSSSTHNIPPTLNPGVDIMGLLCGGFGRN